MYVAWEWTGQTDFLDNTCVVHMRILMRCRQFECMRVLNYWSRRCDFLTHERFSYTISSYGRKSTNLFTLWQSNIVYLALWGLAFINLILTHFVIFERRLNHLPLSVWLASLSFSLYLSTYIKLTSLRNRYFLCGWFGLRTQGVFFYYFSRSLCLCFLDTNNCYSLQWGKYFLTFHQDCVE